ncbi:MAG TPA: hypothetical protein VH700_12785 [Gemmatimonadales bacterium]|jgi:hypothetical protein
MRQDLSRAALALSISSSLFTSGALAQPVDPPVRRPAASMLWVRPAPAPRALPIGIEAEEGSDHTVLGLVIGGGVGFVAGWAFYNTICEAVDNDCSDSRLPYLAIGTGVGAGLGALIGSLVD